MPPRSRSSPPPPPPSSRPPHHEGHKGPKGHKGHRGHKAGRADALDAGAIDAALLEIVPDARDRAFVLRCVLEEGPRHHRVASWALLRMLAAVLAEVGGADPETREGASEPLGMRLPPSVAESSDDAEFPIGIPTTMLHDVLDDGEVGLALECLKDGPPHHSLANAAMTWMLQAIYERVQRQKGPRRTPKTSEGSGG
jgi:hypothetical protein